MRTFLIAGLAVFLLPTAALADDSKDDDDTKADDTKADDTKADDTKDDDTKDEKPKAKKASEEDQPAGDGDQVAVGKAAGRMTMPGGKVLLNAIIEANLGKSAVGKPLSVAPDIWYGASNKLTLGLVHSGRGETGFLTGAGRGLCFGDKDGACAGGLGKIYTSVGGEARIGLTEGGFPLALKLGGLVQAFKPKLVASSKVGVVGRAQGSHVALELAPTVFIGMTQRKVAGVDFNQDVLALPVTVFLNLSPKFAIALQSGVTTTLKKAGDNYQVPAAIGLATWISPKFSFDLAFGLTAVADKNDMTKAFDGRSLSVGVGYGM